MEGFKTESTQASLVKQASQVAQAEQSAQSQQAKKAKSAKDVQKPEFRRRDMEELAKKLDTSTSNASIQFKIEQEDGRTIIEVKDKDSGEVIRTIPNEQAQKIAQNIDDFIAINNEKGLAVDDTF